MHARIPRALALLALTLLALNLLAGAALLWLALNLGATIAALGMVAWLLGLRHAFDADHIAAIDNVTRRLRQRGHRPVAVGLFFSLGHSTVVLVLTLALGLQGSGDFADWLGAWGVPLSLLASGTFLTAIGALNVASLMRPLRTGVKMRLFDRVTDSRAMYPLGLLFGLNLDTAAEIVLLAGAAATAQGFGLPWWGASLFALLFLAGMAAADSAEGLLMLRLYDWAVADSDRTLRLNTATTALAATLALGMAAFQWISLAHWAGGEASSWSLPGGTIGLGVTVLMGVLWVAARWRRSSLAVARAL